jgi:hypothetical protein
VTLAGVGSVEGSVDGMGSGGAEPDGAELGALVAALDGGTSITARAQSRNWLTVLEIRRSAR